MTTLGDRGLVRQCEPRFSDVVPSPSSSNASLPSYLAEATFPSLGGSCHEVTEGADDTGGAWLTERCSKSAWCDVFGGFGRPPPTLRATSPQGSVALPVWCAAVVVVGGCGSVRRRVGR